MHCCHREQKVGFIFVKLREREGQRVDLGRSLKGHLWMVDILSLMLYIKFGCHHHHLPSTRTSLNLHDSAQYGPVEVGRSKRRCVGSI